MKPDADPNEDVPKDEAENAPVAGGGRWQGLKQFFLTRYVKIIDAFSGVLKRLRNRVKKPKGEEGEEDGGREARVSSKKPAPPPAVEAPPVPRSHVRSFFIYLLVLIVGCLAGMTFSFALLSKMLINQAQKIDDQREEIGQLEKQYSRVMESEVKYRNKLTEMETQMSAAARSVAKDPALAAPADTSAPAQGKQIANKKAGNCALESGNPAELAKCIDEFNRKGGR